MSNREKIWAVVPAAGIGRRMMADRPKQYLPLLSKRVIDYSLLGLCESKHVDGVIVGIRQDDQWWRENPFSHDKLLRVSSGGAQRADTVLNALHDLASQGIADARDWVMIHDAVRPCIRQQDISKLVETARTDDFGAILGVKLTDTLKQVNSEDSVEKTLERDFYWRALTPQMFRMEDLRVALQRSLNQGTLPTDESAAMEALGFKPVMVEGHPTNIKITLPSDLEMASLFLGKRIS